MTKSIRPEATKGMRSGEPTGTLERAVAIVAVRIGEHRLTDSLDLSAAPVPTPSAG
ncbi:MAG: hypothetical protein AAF368_20055 [Planctomycetota bacterium]